MDSGCTWSMPRPAYPIVGVNTGGAGTASFVIGGDRLSVLDGLLEVAGSTANDGAYTERFGSSYDAGADETTVNVNEEVIDSTADGNLEIILYTSMELWMNRASPWPNTDAETLSMHLADVCTGDVTVTARVLPGTNPNTSIEIGRLGIIARASEDGETRWIAYVNSRISAQRFYLRGVQDGVFIHTQSVLLTWPAVQDTSQLECLEISLVCSGESIVATLSGIDGTEVLSTTSSVGQDNTYVGIMGNSPYAHMSIPWLLDDFVACSQSTSTANDNCTVNDLFTDSDSTHLEDHLPDKGAPWIVSHTALTYPPFEIVSNRVNLNFSGAQNILALLDVGTGDVALTADLAAGGPQFVNTWHGPQFLNTWHGIVARATADYQNFWAVVPNRISNQLELWKCEAGVKSLEASMANLFGLSPDPSHDYKHQYFWARFTGSSIVASPFSTVLPGLSHSSSFGETNTHCGMYRSTAFFYGSPLPMCRSHLVDNFEVTAL